MEPSQINVNIPGLDMAAINKRAEEYASMGSSSSIVYLNALIKQSKNGAISFRIVVDPKLGLDGGYDLVRYDFRIGGKAYLNPKTVGLPDPFTSEWEMADVKAKSDPVLAAKLKSQDNKPERSILIPVVFCDHTGAIQDPKMKLLSMSLTAAKQLMSSIQAPPNNHPQAGPLLLNPVYGIGVWFTKMGEGKAATYNATPIGQPCALPAATIESCYNVKEMLTKWCDDYNYLQSLLRNYLYGTPVLPNPKDNQQAQPQVYAGAQAPVSVGVVGAAPQGYPAYQAPAPTAYPPQAQPQQYEVPQQPQVFGTPAPAPAPQGMPANNPNGYTAPAPQAPQAYTAPVAQPQQPDAASMGAQQVQQLPLPTQQPPVQPSAPAAPPASHPGMEGTFGTPSPAPAANGALMNEILNFGS